MTPFFEYPPFGRHVQVWPNYMDHGVPMWNAQSAAYAEKHYVDSIALCDVTLRTDHTLDDNITQRAWAFGYVCGNGSVPAHAKTLGWSVAKRTFLLDGEPIEEERCFGFAWGLPDGSMKVVA